MLKYIPWQNQFVKKISLWIGVFLYGIVFWYGLFILPQNLGTIAIFILIILGSWALLYKTDLISNLVACLLITLLFCLPLAWIWRGLVFDNSMFLGRFVFNDAYFYLTDANRLLYGQNFSYFSTRRPLFTGLMAFLLKITQNDLQTSLGILAMNVGVSAYFLAREIRRFAGALTAAFTLCLTFYVYEGHGFAGRVLTENLGLSLGALGLALMLKGTRGRQFWIFCLGAFTLTLALNARAGAFFVLPAVLAFGAFSALFQKESFWLKIILISGSIGLAFGLNFLLVKLIGSSEGQMFSNFSNTIYGLAAGYKGWGYMGSQNLGNTNPYLATWELIKANPYNLLYGLMSSFRDYLQPETMFQYMYFEAQQSAISYILYGITIFGLVRLWRIRRTPLALLVWALFIGCFLSVSFVPPIDEGIRALTATIPINALAAGILFYSPQSGDDEKTDPARPWKFGVGIYTLALVFICLFGPLFVKNTPLAAPALPTLDCPTYTDQVNLKINPGYYAIMVSDGPKYSFLPTIRRKEILTTFEGFRDNGFPALLLDFKSLIEAVKNFTPGRTLIMGFELREASSPGGFVKPVFLILNTTQVADYNGVVSVCARLAYAQRLAINRFYYEASIIDHP